MLVYVVALIAAAMILGFGVAILVVLLDYLDVSDDMSIDEPMVWSEEEERAA